MRQRIAAVLLAAAVAVAGATISAQPAQAHYVGLFTRLDSTQGSAWPAFDGDGGCHQGYFCAWSYQYLLGFGVGFYSDKWDWAASDVPKNGSISINNNSESWANWGFDGSFDEIRIYNTAGGKDYMACIENYDGFTYATNLANKVSANKWVTTC